MLEVKFYENRANGQSKGFCAVSFGSESSGRLVMDKLPRKELHGMNPVVTFATKQALQQVFFLNISSKDLFSFCVFYAIYSIL